MIDRRGFLKALGIGAGAALLVSSIPALPTRRDLATVRKQASPIYQFAYSTDFGKSNGPWSDPNTDILGDIEQTIDRNGRILLK
jgi:hypothetical protein